MANEEQAPPKQQAEVNYWGDIDAMMKDLKLREAVLGKALGEKAIVVHNAVGPWYSWQSPDGEWHEGDKIGWPYDFHTDDLLGQILGNPLSHFFIGLIMGARQSTNAAIEAVLMADIEAKHSPVAAAEMAELEGRYKPPKKSPMVYAYKTKMKKGDGTFIDVDAYEFVDFPKEVILPGAYPGLMEGAMGGAGGSGGLDGAFSKEVLEKLEETYGIARNAQADADKMALKWNQKYGGSDI